MIVKFSGRYHRTAYDENTARRLFGALEPTIQKSYSPTTKAEALNSKNEIVEEADPS